MASTNNNVGGDLGLVVVFPIVNVRIADLITLFPHFAVVGTSNVNVHSLFANVDTVMLMPLADRSSAIVDTLSVNDVWQLWVTVSLTSPQHIL